MNTTATSPPPLMDMLAGLIACPSVSSVRPELDTSNRAVIDLLAGWLEEMGFTCRIQELPGQPHKANLIATLGSGPGGLVLAGHTDTVPYDDGGWASDPFTLTERNGRLHGLGTTDMKGFFALALEAARGLSASDLCAPLTIFASADEETTMAGAKALKHGDLSARYAVIGEPTSLTPIRLHKGILMEAIHLVGRSGHSSNPALGINAMEGMHQVLTTLMAWREELGSRHHDPRFLVPVPTLNLGHIHGGDNPNRICADCTLHIDLRPLPGMAIAPLREELHERVRRCLQDRPLTVSFTPLFDGVAPLETAATSPVVQLAEQLTGSAAGAVTFGTEGPYLSQLGMETVILGPGDLDQAHQPDESLATERIDPTVHLLKGMIHHLCMTR